MDIRGSDSKVKFRKKINSKYAAAISVSITTVGLGIIFSWTSPSLPYLTSPASSFPVTEIKGAWIASLVGFGTISGFLINPILINKLGTKKTLLFLAAPQIFSWAMIYFGRNWLVLCFARIIGGFGYGAGMCSTAIYLSEIGDKNTRGIFLTLIKMSINIGIFVSMFLGAFLSYDAMNLVILCIPIIFVVTFYSMPETKQFVDEGDCKEISFDDAEEKLKKDFRETKVKEEGGFEEKESANVSKDTNGIIKNANGMNDKINGGVKNTNGPLNHIDVFNVEKYDTEYLDCHCQNKLSNSLDKNSSITNEHCLNKSENCQKSSDNSIIAHDLDEKDLLANNSHKEKEIDVLKEDTILVVQNNSVVIVKDDTVDVIESQSFDFLNENTNCFLKENLDEESQALLNLQNSVKNGNRQCFKDDSVNAANKDAENLTKRNSTFPLENVASVKTLKEETFEEEIDNLLKYPSGRNRNVWWKLFFVQNNRNAFLIIVAASLTDIFSGHMAIVSYTQQIFEYSDASLKAEYAALILAILKIFASFISTLVVETFGRRNLFLITGILAGISQGFVGLFFFLKLYLKIEVGAITWLPLVGVSMYEVVGSVGLSSLYYVYQGELFSDDVKGLGVTCTNIFYELITFFVKLYFQIVIDTIGIYSLFWVFGVCCFLGSFITYWMSPETKGKSKQEIQRLLGADLRTRER